MRKYFHGHFLSEGHNGLINDVDIVFIDKTDPSDPIGRIACRCAYVLFLAVLVWNILVKLPSIRCQNVSILY